MFNALANGFEHVFTYTARMINEFENEFTRMPTADEFRDLSHKLFVLLGKEARFSRQKNTTAECQFDRCNKFFLLNQTASGIDLKINNPTPDEEGYIAEVLPEFMGAAEQIAVESKLALGEHYGCPAAFIFNDGKIYIRLVFCEVSRDI